MSVTQKINSKYFRALIKECSDYNLEELCKVFVVSMKLTGTDFAELRLKSCPFWRNKNHIPVNPLHLDFCDFCFLAETGIIDYLEEYFKNDR